MCGHSGAERARFSDTILAEHFIGEADGKEVFSEDCVGEACSLGS